MTRRWRLSDLFASEDLSGIDEEALDALLRDAEDIWVSIDEDPFEGRGDDDRVELRVSAPACPGITVRLDRATAEEMARRIRRFSEEQEEERLERLEFWYR